MTRDCAFCGRPFEAKRKTAKYCSGSHRALASQRAAKGAPTPAEIAPPPGQEPSEHNRPLVMATRRELEAAGRLDTILGQQALRLAERMYSAMDTGSAVAALSRELRAVMMEALADLPASADAVDELTERRRRKASGA